MADSSTEIGNLSDKLAEAENKQKLVENIEQWITDVDSGVAIVYSIQIRKEIQNPDGSNRYTYLTMDTANYSVDIEGRDPVRTMLLNKKTNLINEVTEIKAEVDSALP